MRKHNFQILGLIVLSLSLAGVAEIRGLQLGSRSAKDWIERLEKADRVAGMKVDEVIPRLKLKPGDVVADIGAGSGIFSRPLARAVAPGGKVLAVDIDKDLLDFINRRAKDDNIENIQTVMGKFDDPDLPMRQVDLAFINDVLHHIEHREAYLKTLATYLKPQGRIAVIDLLKGHQNEPEMQIKQDQVVEWMKAAGFHLAEEVKLFDDKFFVVFERN